MKFLIAGSDFMDRLQLRWSSNAEQSILPLIGILGLPMEDSNRLRRLLIRHAIYSSQLINNHRLPGQSPEIASQEITDRCISLMPGDQ
jgi:hypothetical protein